jgi:hypothetical protein
MPDTCTAPAGSLDGVFASAPGEVAASLSTAQIAALKEEQPEWRRERSTRAEAQRAEARLRAERSGRRRDDPVGG